ncbi:MAG: PspC domain-containing protein [Adlercreutzia equolifaciens]
MDRRVRRSDDVSVVTGRVASASGIADYFNVDVVFADFESRIIDYDCDCPAAARFSTACASTAWR